MFVRERVCVCVCVCVCVIIVVVHLLGDGAGSAGVSDWRDTIHTGTSIYMCVCVCV